MKRVLAVLIFLFMMLLSACGSSVGVIGGADGPTSIIVSGPIFPWGVIMAAALLAVIVAVLVFCLRRR